MNKYFLLFVILSLFSCETSQNGVLDDQKECEINKDSSIADLHTLSNYQSVFTSHVHLDISVDFEVKLISGSVRHDLSNPCKKDKFILDTKNLTIKNVFLDNGENASFYYGDFDELLGTPLVIDIQSNTKSVTVE